MVVDKGALDALMGEDSPESREAGGRLLSEVRRLLSPCGGAYLCVTLAQPHVLGERSPSLTWSCWVLSLVLSESIKSFFP